MHYYKHHIGDYRRDTGHLSLLEHGIYRQLLDWYYLEESPIPLETHSVYRRLSARTESEMRAVDAVLSDFFTKTADGWINGRCDSEIEEYQGNTEKNRENGKRGGRPKKTQSVSDGFNLETQAEPNFNPSETLTINHKPLTINQEPLKEQKQSAPDGDPPKKPKSRKTPIPENFSISDRVSAWATAKGHNRLEERLEHFVSRCKMAGYQYVDWDEAFMTAIRDDWAKLPSLKSSAVDSWAGRDI